MAALSKQQFFSAFLVAVAANLLAAVLGIYWLEWASKPLLMPLLWMYFVVDASEMTGFHRRIGWGLIFSTAGDVLLLFGGEELFFMLGLGSFLVAHICYISAFRKLHRKDRLADSPSNLLWIIVLSAYGVLLYAMLYPALDAVMRAAVLVYALAITFMSLSCLALRGQQPKEAFHPMMAGALLFVVSDSLLAVDRFLMPLPQAGLLIMATYIGAQYLIVRGALRSQSVS